jgi:hypothetical protein
MPPDPSQALEPFRSYLEVLARVHLDPRLRAKRAFTRIRQNSYSPASRNPAPASKAGRGFCTCNPRVFGYNKSV